MYVVDCSRAKTPQKPRNSTEKREHGCKRDRDDEPPNLSRKMKKPAVNAGGF